MTYRYTAEINTIRLFIKLLSTPKNLKKSIENPLIINIGTKFMALFSNTKNKLFIRKKE